MFRVNIQKTLKIILLFALLNSSIFMMIQMTYPNGILRLGIIILMNISVILLIILFSKINIKEKDMNIYFKIIYTLIILWSLYTFFRSFSLDTKVLITLFGHYLFGWVWFTPFAIVFGFNIFNWLKLFDFFANLLLFGSILALGSYFYSLEIIFGLLEWMAFLPILLLTYFYQNRRNKKIIIFALIMYFVLTFFSGQRANIIFILFVIVFFIFEFFRQHQVEIYKKIIGFFLIFLGSIYLILQVNTFVENMSKDKDLTTDTRTFLFVELFDDLDDTEEVIGRGALGTYYSPYFAYTRKHNLGGDSPTRSSIEVGYLEIILKGGYIMLVLYILILLPAAYLGIFKSKNIIARACGYFILLYIILWLVSYYPIYSVEYILLWMATGTAISSSMRNIENSEILIKRKGIFEFEK